MISVVNLIEETLIILRPGYRDRWWLAICGSPQSEDHRSVWAWPRARVSGGVWLHGREHHGQVLFGCEWAWTRGSVIRQCWRGACVPVPWTNDCANHSSIEWRVHKILTSCEPDSQPSSRRALNGCSMTTGWRSRPQRAAPTRPSDCPGSGRRWWQWAAVNCEQI